MYIVQPVKCSPASISCKLASLSLTSSKHELRPLPPSSSRITHPFRRKALQLPIRLPGKRGKTILIILISYGNIRLRRIHTSF
jgi:hypothetical protein